MSPRSSASQPVEQQQMVLRWCEAGWLECRATPLDEVSANGATAEQFSCGGWRIDLMDLRHRCCCRSVQGGWLFYVLADGDDGSCGSECNQLVIAQVSGLEVVMQFVRLHGLAPSAIQQRGCSGDHCGSRRVGRVADANERPDAGGCLEPSEFLDFDDGLGAASWVAGLSLLELGHEPQSSCSQSVPLLRRLRRWRQVHWSRLACGFVDGWVSEGRLLDRGDFHIGSRQNAKVTETERGGKNMASG